MKINKFITAGIAAGVGLLPAISNAMTAAHVATIGHVYNSSPGVSQAVATVVNPENMNAVQKLFYNHPALGLAALGVMMTTPLIAVAVYALSDSNSNEKDNYRNTVSESNSENKNESLMDKIKNIRNKVFSNENDSTIKLSNK